MGGNTEKDLTPDLTSGSDLHCWEPELMGNFFLKIFFHPICVCSK